jgi:(+)-trans-carveol dehydrogenase
MIADVRKQEQLDEAVARGMDQFGRLDVICANAGIASYAPATAMSAEMWDDMIDVQLSGVWHTIKAGLGAMIAGGRGGSIVITSSAAGLRAFPNLIHYAAAKHGVVGLMKGLATELGPLNIRVNTVHPGTVDTPMVQNEPTMRFFMPDAAEPRFEDFAGASKSMMLLPVPWVEAVDVSNAIVFLASDEGRFVTGTMLSVDAGATLR